VKKGEVLARVRESDYQHAVEQYKGQLEQAQAAAEKSKQDFGRAQALYNANAMTQSDYDGAKAQNDSSQGSVVTAQAAVAQAQQSLSDCELRAPTDGQILIAISNWAPRWDWHERVHDGRYQAGESGCWNSGHGACFGDARQEARIPNGTYPQEFLWPGDSHCAASGSEKQDVQVEVTVPNSNDLLKSGMVATLDLGHAKLTKSVLVVPLGASFQRRAIRTGHSACLSSCEMATRMWRGNESCSRG